MFYRDWLIQEQKEIKSLLLRDGQWYRVEKIENGGDLIVREGVTQFVALTVVVTGDNLATVVTAVSDVIAVQGVPHARELGQP